MYGPFHQSFDFKLCPGTACHEQGTDHLATARLPGGHPYPTELPLLFVWMWSSRSLSSLGLDKPPDSPDQISAHNEQPAPDRRPSTIRLRRLSGTGRQARQATGTTTPHHR